MRKTISIRSCGEASESSKEDRGDRGYNVLNFSFPCHVCVCVCVCCSLLFNYAANVSNNENGFLVNTTEPLFCLRRVIGRNFAGNFSLFDCLVPLLEFFVDCRCHSQIEHENLESTHLWRAEQKDHHLEVANHVSKVE